MSKKSLRKTPAPKTAKRVRKPAARAVRDADGNLHFSRAKDEPRPPIVRAFLDDNAMVVDNFAGGGGASSGVVRALRSLGWNKEPDIAINHDPEAIAMHKANHPETKHYIEDVWNVDPHEACGDRPVGLAWFSPTCTHFSKAKGTALDESSVKIRGLCWVAVRWAAAVRPRIICLENVEEFLKFGPLHRQHTDGCNGKNGVGAACKKACRIHKPIKEREGELFEAFVSRLKKLGYVVEWKLLRACDYGAPTTRRRLFLVARCDGKPIAWPEPTHGPDRPNPYRTAAECIDWAVPCPSIFERDRPLADKTLARIARGIQKFVLDNPKPFIVPVAYGGDARVNDIDEPMRTICGNRGGHAIAVPYLVHRSNGERPEKIVNGRVIKGQAPRIYDVEKPLGTVVAQGQKHAVSVALLIKNNGGNNDKAGCSMAVPVEKPMDTIACRDQKSLTVAHLVKMRGTSESHVASSAQSVEEPVPTVTASGTHLAQVAAFLVRYNGQSVGQNADEPAGTLTTKDRYGLVTVMIQGEEYILADIGMRMLTPRELYNAQGFDREYVIDCDFEGKPLTKTAQIRMCGNSVPPVMAEVIARAQMGVE
jgi:DNA (cytosine-5)-methyltransferase 1